MADLPGRERGRENVGGAEHDVAMDNVTSALGIPRALLEEAIVEARAVGRHRVRAVPARRIDELISKIADVAAGQGSI